jgi:integrase
MGRRSDGWKLRIDPRTGQHIVRFRHEGKRYNLSTRERDPHRAAEEAARIYAQTVTGRRRLRRSPAEVVPFDAVAADWLASIESSVDSQTWKSYELHVLAHLEPFFLSIDKVTTEAVEEYKRDRLRNVKRRTLLKELSALRGIVGWAVQCGHLEEPPMIANPPPKVQGIPHPQGKRDAIVLTEEQVDAIIAALPLHAKRGGSSIRDRAIVSWETGLRPEAIASLSVPEHYRKGERALRLLAAADKARYERELPLTPRAREALDRCAPDIGLIFGPLRWGPHIKAAAASSGLPLDIAKRVTVHALRHSRLTYLAERTDNLAGLQYLAGHKHLSTTARYVKASQRAAEAVLEGIIGSPSGHRSERAAKGRGRKKSVSRGTSK